MTIHTMTDAERIEYLEAQIARMRANGKRKLTLKVGEKGGLSVCGMGRFPVTLYRDQWEQLLEPTQVQAILDFCKDNNLKHKGE